MPRIKLTKSAIDGLPTPNSDAVYWDTGLPAFGVKVTPTGLKVFIILYRIGGSGSKLRKYTIGPYRRVLVQMHQATVLKNTRRVTGLTHTEELLALSLAHQIPTRRHWVPPTKWGIAMVSTRSNNIKQIRLERMLEQAKISRTEFLREKPGLACQMAGAVALAGMLSLLVMVGIRPTREQTLEATVRMEKLTIILGHTKAIAPDTAREIIQIIRQPVYDCDQVACDPVLKLRNRIARLKLQALLQTALFHKVKQDARALLASHTREHH